MAFLAVDLRTDFTRRNFSTVEVHLVRRRRRHRMQPVFIDFVGSGTGDLVRGVRLVQVDDLDDGQYSLVVRLLDRRGVPIGFRQTLVRMRGNPLVVVVITR